MSFFSIRRLTARVLIKGEWHTISGCPMTVTITNDLGVAQGTAEIQFIGLPYDLMNAITWIPVIGEPNPQMCIEIYTGSGDLVYRGDITLSYADFNAQPDIVFNVTSIPCAHSRLTQAPPVSVSPKEPIVTVTDFAEQLAKTEGLILVPPSKGLTLNADGTVSGAFAEAVTGYYDQGSLRAQVEAMCKDKGMLFNTSTDGTKIHISHENNPSIVDGLTMSKETGMIGYPVIGQNGVEVRCLYNPQIDIRTKVYIDSIVPKSQASGKGWTVTKVSHKLSSGRSDGGQWETQFTAMPIRG